MTRTATSHLRKFGDLIERYAPSRSPLLPNDRSKLDFDHPVVLSIRAYVASISSHKVGESNLQNGFISVMNSFFAWTLRASIRNLGEIRAEKGTDLKDLMVVDGEGYKKTEVSAHGRYQAPLMCPTRWLDVQDGTERESHGHEKEEADLFVQPGRR